MLAKPPLQRWEVRIILWLAILIRGAELAEQIRQLLH